MNPEVREKNVTSSDMQILEAEARSHVAGVHASRSSYSTNYAAPAERNDEVLARDFIETILSRDVADFKDTVEEFRKRQELRGSAER